MPLKKIVAFLTLITGVIFQNPGLADPTIFDREPVYVGTVGQYAPLKYYPVAVAATADALWSLNLANREVQKLDAMGEVISRFPIIDSWPRDIEADASGNVFIADTNGNKIRKYDPQGNLVLEIGSSGNAPGQFSRLRAISIDQNGNIYAADKTTQLSVFDAAGTLLWNNQATITTGNNYLINPQGMSRDVAGNIYVADTGRRQILIYDASGNYLRSIGPSGPGWNFGSNVAVTVAADGSIFVLMRHQTETLIGFNQVFKFTNAGDFISSWGAKGRAPGELWEPQGMTIGPTGNILVAGFQGHNIVTYDQQGNLVEEFNGHNIQPGEFAHVRGAVVGENANLYVTDFWNQLVQVFDRYGLFLTTWGERGQGDGQYFNFPRFTAANDLGQIYVSDDREVRVFEADGTFVARSDWIIFPGGIEVDNTGSVWITGQGENTVRSYTPTLDLVSIFDGSNVPQGFNSPYGITQGLNGNLYVADTFNHRIVRMATDGSFQLEFGSSGTGPGQFSAPVGITADSEGRIFVSETWRKRIQVFSPDGNYLSGWDVPDQPGKDVARVYELSMDGDYFLYAPDHTQGQAEVHKYALVPTVTAAGKPAYTAGQNLGFFIWSDDNSTWHIRWSSDGTQRAFSGVISSTVPVIGLTPVELEAGDMAQLTAPSRIDFFTLDADGEDGIDILVGDTGVLTFDLKIDGIESANAVTVGAGAFSPVTLPLPLSTAGSPVVIDQQGKPSYQYGTDFGYFIWQDADDGEWHIRWSGGGPTASSFCGSISSTGDFSNVRTFWFNASDTLTLGSDTLSFCGFAGAFQDGLDFFVPDGATVTFDLLVNGNSAGGFIHIGAAGTVVAQGMVALVSQSPQGVSGGGLGNITTVNSPAYVQAQDAGYFLWQDDDDGEWHVRWSGDSITTFQYEGIISSTLPISNVRPYSFEGNDSVSISPTELSFDGFAGAGEDGLDFFVPEGAIVSFSLLTNQNASITDVFIGSTNANPAAMPFSLLSVTTSVSVLDIPAYTPAQDAGYFLWQTADTQWHLRWSGDSIRTFSYEGTISSSEGISSFSTYSYEANDQVNSIPSGLSFSGLAGAGEDGLDFFVPAGSQLIFDVKVDGDAAPSAVNIGAGNAMPSSMPFSLYSPQ